MTCFPNASFLPSTVYSFILSGLINPRLNKVWRIPFGFPSQPLVLSCIVIWTGMPASLQRFCNSFLFPPAFTPFVSKSFQRSRASRSVILNLISSVVIWNGMPSLMHCCCNTFLLVAIELTPLLANPFSGPGLVNQLLLFWQMVGLFW